MDQMELKMSVNGPKVASSSATPASEHDRLKLEVVTLSVADIDAARECLVQRGVEVREVADLDRALSRDSTDRVAPTTRQLHSATHTARPYRYGKSRCVTRSRSKRTDRLGDI
jgi:hypothetical protein